MEAFSVPKSQAVATLETDKNSSFLSLLNTLEVQSCWRVLTCRSILGSWPRITSLGLAETQTRSFSPVQWSDQKYIIPSRVGLRHFISLPWNHYTAHWWLKGSVDLGLLRINAILFHKLQSCLQRWRKKNYFTREIYSSRLSSYSFPDWVRLRQGCLCQYTHAHKHMRTHTNTHTHAHTQIYTHT